jgi:hypothetical protein
MSWLARLASALAAALTAGCAATFPGDASRIITFADTVSDFDVVPPGWITPDGNAGGTYTFGTDSKALAFIFPSLPRGEEARGSLHVSIPDFLSQNGWFRGGVFAFATAPAAQPTIEISTARSDSAIVIDIDASSMSQILRLDLDRFRKLQAAYVGWLLGQSNCLADCFSPAAADALRAFWKAHVLREAGFRQFAARYLNPPAPVTLSAFDTKMFATRIAPRQQLSVTWGNNNFYPGAQLRLSYSRTTSGGNTRLQIIDDTGRLRLYPARSCATPDIAQIPPDPADDVTLPYPRDFKDLFPMWFMPVYNLFDLHNPYLLTAPKRPKTDSAACRDRARQAPRYLFLLTPAVYVKPDNRDRISQFETEGGLGSDDDPKDQYKVLARQFVILACDSADPRDVADEWRRLLDAARGHGGKHGACGPYVHAVLSAKTFVELRNRFSLDGRTVEDGVVHFTGIGQAVGPSLGARLNAEAAPGAKPLLHLLRALPAESPDPRRVLLHFYTTMSDVLDQAAVLEGDDIHAISVPEILR